jgi:hypothetical protein
MNPGIRQGLEAAHEEPSLEVLEMDSDDSAGDDPDELRRPGPGRSSGD